MLSGLRRRLKVSIEQTQHREHPIKVRSKIIQPTFLQIGLVEPCSTKMTQSWKIKVFSMEWYCLGFKWDFWVFKRVNPNQWAWYNANKNVTQHKCINKEFKQKLYVNLPTISYKWFLMKCLIMYVQVDRKACTCLIMYMQAISCMSMYVTMWFTWLLRKEFKEKGF